jgi:monooxygenase
MNGERMHHDVLIVGAGISGIGAAYHLQTQCPSKTYAILEARGRLGGTWDLFRYPGVRSDSDMHTLGFSFRPWTNPKAIADGPAILKYLEDTAEAFGIDRKIQYGKRVVRAAFSSREARWTVDVKDAETGAIATHTCQFLFVCAGYYDYAKGYTPDFKGTDTFRGSIVHPQFWKPEMDYAGKRVVVIGSGATAVTLVPELAKKAAHVTMLQRSPTYVLAVPERDQLANWLRGRLPAKQAYAATRWKNVLVFMAFYAWCRRFPDRAKGFLRGEMTKRLGSEIDVEKHFSPRYRPWEQRLCFAPDGDFFAALKSGRASVVTDRIAHFSEHGIRLESGTTLDADIVVTATGLKVQLFGGMRVDVDGRPVSPSETLVYKGMMCSDVPNLAFAVGYTNASWTLKVDLTASYVCRLLHHMDAKGYRTCTPRRREGDLGEEPLIDFSSGYVARALGELPKQGTRAPWKLYQNYVFDLLSLRHAPLTDDAMEFGR